VKGGLAVDGALACEGVDDVAKSIASSEKAINALKSSLDTPVVFHQNVLEFPPMFARKLCQTALYFATGCPGWGFVAIRHRSLGRKLTNFG
jgi:hypothetical protein